MSERGFVKLDRNLLTWGWKQNPEMVALWVEILLQANIENRVWQGEKYERGTFPTSLQKLSTSTGLSLQTIRTCLKRLKSTNEITTETTNRGMKISVVKWEDYQGYKGGTNKQNNTLPNNQLTSNQHATNMQLTTLKEIKNERKKEINIYKGYSDEFISSMEAFKEMRKSIKKPLTTKAEKMIINKLSQLSSSEQDQIEILNQSTMNSWQSVYPLKDTQIKNIDNIVYDQKKNKSLSQHELDELLALRGKQ